MFEQLMNVTDALVLMKLGGIMTAEGEVALDVGVVGGVDEVGEDLMTTEDLAMQVGEVEAVALAVG